MNLPAQNRSTVSITLVLALGVVAIFTVPYLVPVHDGISYSYMFGFNNRAAIAILIAFAVGFGFWSRGLGFTLPDLSSQTAPAFRRTAYILIAISFLASILLWLGSILIPPLGEAQYFLDRYEMYRILGPPYKAFNFYYGPVMFYLPVWISRIARIPVGHAYFLALALEWAFGSWLLWKITEFAARGTQHGRTIFVFFWLLFFASLLGSGAQYSPVRFCLGLFFAMLVWQLHHRKASNISTFGMASLGTVATLSYSPDQGIAFMLGTVTFFLFCVRERRRESMNGLAGYLAISAVALLVAFKTGELNALLSIGGGALNFPVVANTHTVFLLLLLIIAGCVAVAAFRNRASDHPLVYLICLSFFTLPAALSRADIGHIVINTLGALIAALVVLSQYRSVWKWLRIALLLFAMMLLYGATAYRSVIRDDYLKIAFGSRYHSQAAENLITKALRFADGQRAASRLRELQNTYGPSRNEGMRLPPPGVRFYAPQGIERSITPYPGDVEIITGRSVYPMTGVAIVQEKIDELKAHSDWPLLLPTNNPVACDENPDSVRAGLKHNLGVPYMPRPSRKIVAAIPLCDFINAHYVPSNYLSPAPGYFVWIPGNPASVHP